MAALRAIGRLAFDSPAAPLVIIAGVLLVGAAILAPILAVAFAFGA